MIVASTKQEQSALSIKEINIWSAHLNLLTGKLQTPKMIAVAKVSCTQACVLKAVYHWGKLPKKLRLLVSVMEVYCDLNVTLSKCSYFSVASLWCTVQWIVFTWSILCCMSTWRDHKYLKLNSYSTTFTAKSWEFKQPTQTEIDSVSLQNSSFEQLLLFSPSFIHCY